MNKYKQHIINLNYYFFLALVFFLPIKDNFLPTILSAWILTWGLECNLKYKFISFNYKNKLYISLLMYFFLTILALFYTKDINEGWYHIQIKLALVFLPIIVFSANIKVKQNLNTILAIFVLANFIIVLYLLFYALLSNLIIENGTWYIKYWHWSNFEHYGFWQLINMRQNNFSSKWLSPFLHPSYLSMYILFSIIILVNFFRQKLIGEKIYKIIVGIIIVFFVLMIYLLQSRAGFIAFTVSSFFVVLFEIYRKKQKRYFFTGIIVLALGGIFILSSTKMQKIIEQTSMLLKDPDKIELKKMDVRFQTNFSALQIVKEHFWFGVGPANMYDELKKQFEKYGFEKAVKERLNAHNQYLETFAGLGVFGFLSLMYIIIGGFVYAYKHKHYLLFFLLLILSVNFLFESMLNRINGILFMMLFYSLFVFMKTNDTPTIDK